MGGRWQHPWRVLVVPYYLNRYARQVHVLRVALAFLFGLALVLASGIPHGGWMLVTILIVLGGVPHWGGVRRKALERMGGSLLGALAGLAAILLHGVSPYLCYAWMLLVVALSSWHAQGRGGYLALLTGITLVIVGGLGDEPINEALWRSCNVLIGSLIGMVAAATLRCGRWTAGASCWRTICARRRCCIAASRGACRWRAMRRWTSSTAAWSGCEDCCPR
ncbi:FUSC family protein [Chromobacterium violaceum]|uniref:FUSC family protein n=1 Tax=Chromobacterium violaceum TaxID=536 RepID=UPI000E16572E|nr:FUSC family protein [Chromobacterium violaceum]SUX88906.1 Inner membrane protein yeeA [Chromobacterium violaceum]